MEDSHKNIDSPSPSDRSKVDVSYLLGIAVSLIIILGGAYSGVLRSWSDDTTEQQRKLYDALRTHVEDTSREVTRRGEVIRRLQEDVRDLQSNDRTQDAGLIKLEQECKHHRKHL